MNSWIGRREVEKHGELSGDNSPRARLRRHTGAGTDSMPYSHHNCPVAPAWAALNPDEKKNILPTNKALFVGIFYIALRGGTRGVGARAGRHGGDTSKCAVTEPGDAA